MTSNISRKKRQRNATHNLSGKRSQARDALLACSISFPLIQAAVAAELPVPCAAGACGNNTFVTSGAVTAVQSGNSLTIDQTSSSALLNWQSFNISADGTVTFKQPDAASVALNRIFQADPSRILGALNANGRVYLINQNGIVFGEGAQVNVGGLIASSLNVTNEALERGIARAADAERPAFEAFKNANGDALPSGAVQVKQGAVLKAAEGGAVMLFGPVVHNEGRIETPGGQAVLAAGDSIYLVPSTDSDLRGLIVAVGAGGTVTNGRTSNSGVTKPADLVGQIIAERGNVSLVGLAVNQLGRVSATTSVRENGSIRLVAQDSATAVNATNMIIVQPKRAGTLEVGANSVTEVTLGTDKATTVDVNAQPRSLVDMLGEAIRLREGATVSAKGGRVNITAQHDTSPELLTTPVDVPAADARIVIEKGVKIDVSGANVELDMERNLVRAELRGNELRNSPLQRDGVLRGQAVFIDSRRGTPLADVSGQIGAVERDVSERNLAGGTITIRSQNETIVAPDASFDISGGSIRYRDGYLNTTKLLAADGSVVDIGDASADRLYAGIVTGYTKQYTHWGVTEAFPGFVTSGQRGAFEKGYIEGKDAGVLTLYSPRMIFDGKIVANRVVGEHQQKPTVPLAASSAALYRAVDQVPLGGRLVIGVETPAVSATGEANYFAPSIQLAADAVLPSLRNAAGGVFDPISDLWPDELDTLNLSPQMLQDSGVTRLGLFSDGTVTIGGDQTLALAAGGELVIGAGAVNIDGKVTAPSGRIDITSRPALDKRVESGITLSNDTVLSTQGLWINDNPLLAGAGETPMWIHGGSISIKSLRGDLNASAGSVLDVTGGAAYGADGQITAGLGGNISLATTGLFDERAAELHLGSTLRSFSLTRGGALNITANGICIGATCETQEGVLNVSADLFTQGGFSSYSLESAHIGAHVKSGTTIDLFARNLDFRAGVGRQLSLLETGADLTPYVFETVLPIERRSAVNFALANSTRNLTLAGGGVTAADFLNLGDLTLERGSVINADPGAEIAFKSSTRMVIDGAIIAPSGDVSFGLTASLALGVGEFADSQAIWLGDNARIDVSGAKIIRTDAAGHRVGDVLDGGTVEFRAARGYVVTSTGSVIDASGSNADIDIRQSSTSGQYVARNVASAGGTIDFAASEGLLLNGELHAQSGAPGKVAAGELRFTLDPSQRADPGPNDASPVVSFPAGERTITLQQDVAPILVDARSNIPRNLNGQAILSAAKIDASGADSLILTVRNPANASNDAPESIGKVMIADGVSLDLGRRLVIDAPGIESLGGTANLQARYVALGLLDRGFRNVKTQGAAEPVGTLNVTGDLVELMGNFSILGFDAVNLRSSGDMRLRGLQGMTGESQRTLTGKLVSDANTLTLTSQQLYPTTLTQFTVDLLGDAEQTLRIEQAAGTGANVLSAGSALTLRADRVEQAGTLRAPFGSITLDAADIVLEAGSVTSTSAHNATIPFGRTQGGLDWVYELPYDEQTLVIGSANNPLPAQKITLDGDRVAVNAGSVIDVSGGGDLQAQEFVPGVTGSIDLLSPSANAKTYAVVPSLGSTFAPYDAQSYTGSSLQPGDSIYLDGGAGLPAGNYALLPARYATLPGAYLVTLVDGYQDISAGESLGRIEGGAIVAGRLTFGTGALGDSRTQGVYVRTAESVLKTTRYDVTGGNSFFGGLDNLSAAARLPRDAGVLSLLAVESLELDGALRAAAAKDGRGAALEVAGSNIAVVADGGQAKAPEGYLAVNAADISGLGAQTIVLGGSIVASGDDAVLNVTSQNVLFGDGAVLKAPEIFVGARDSVVLETGARVEGTGAAAASAVGDDGFNVAGDSAVLRVSSLGQSEVTREGFSSATGTIDIRDGATVAATGSVLLDSSLEMKLDGDISAAGASIYFGANNISLGDAPEATSGLVLSETQLARFGQSELVFASRQAVDIFGDFSLQARGLVFDTAAVRRMSGEGTVTLTADQVAFRGADSLVSSSLAAGSGVLAINTGTLAVEGGHTLVEGFSNSALTARDGVRFAEDGGLTLAGNVDLTTSVLFTDAGVDGSLDASGAMRILGISGAAPATRLAGVGGQLAISAASLDVSSVFALPSGELSLTARTGNLSLSSGARVQLEGRSAKFDDQIVATNGGTLKLVANAGAVTVGEGVSIDVSSGGQHAAAGGVEISAPKGTVDLRGTLSATAADVGHGGAFSVDALKLPSLSSINTRLNAGGFDRMRSFRQRGAGTLVVEAGEQNAIRASSVSLAADQGGILVNGSIVAQAATGGKAYVGLAASSDINIAGTVRVAADEGASSRVELSSANGGIALRAGSTLDFQGESDGELWLRLPRESVLTLGDADVTNDRLVLAGTVRGVERTTVEGVKVYDLADGQIDFTHTEASLANPWFADAAAFAASALDINTALGTRLPGVVRTLAGIEARSEGDINVSSAWNLYDWRFGDPLGEQTAGVLTLRAGGDLLINNSISDGFATTNGGLLADTPSTWSYRLVGGADLSGAAPLAVATNTSPSAIGGSVVLAPNALARTGDGFINIAAAGDIRLADKTSAIYTAGLMGPGVRLPQLGASGGLVYPVDGGDISLSAGRDIVSPGSDQLFSQWLWRAGGAAGAIPVTQPASATGWTINFARFQQNVGALAGGDVSVSAGRNINDLSVSIPTVGRQVGGTTPATSVVEVVGGGNLDISAGGDILGGTYFVGRGNANIESGGSIAAGANNLFPLLALGEGAIAVSARRDLNIESILNPTLIPLVPQGQQQNRASSFTTYSENSAVDLKSASGAIRLRNDTSAVKANYASINFGTSTADLTSTLTIYPPRLTATAFSGDISVEGSATLFPSAQGTLSLLAGNDLLIGQRGTGFTSLDLVVSDSDPALWPTAANPSRILASTLAPLLNPLASQFHADIPVHAEPELMVEDDPIRLVAREGDIVFDGESVAGTVSRLWAAKSARLVAGGDIVNPNIVAQNLHAGDVTLLKAGRDITFPLQRDTTGRVLTNGREIRVDGPGYLTLEAGRNIDLQTSVGVSTAGNLLNPALPEGGASIEVAVGLNGKERRYDAFMDEYLKVDGLYVKDVSDYMFRISGKRPATPEAAIAQFRALPESNRSPLLNRILVSELRRVGREAARTGSNNFTEAFAALTKLFPGSNPDIDKGEVNAYDGDLTLYFSRMYTRNGGDISVFAPGGLVNVGLATPPTSFGVDKKPEELGMVVQSTGHISSVSYDDFQVNESRVFAADGGNILVWATRGDIDAGRGAKTAISAPPPAVSFDENGVPRLTISPALAGSGIQTLATTTGRKPGDVDLFAPRGVVNAGDAGIVAGNLTIAATAVLGANNIQVSGTSVGVPVDTGGLAAGLTGASNAASGATSSTTNSLTADTRKEDSPAPLADSALTWLDVFVEGFGEESCKPNDAECLQRQKKD